MKYKNNVAEKLTQLEATANRIQFQVNRNADQDATLESISDLKEQIVEALFLGNIGPKKAVTLMTKLGKAPRKEAIALIKKIFMDLYNGMSKPMAIAKTYEYLFEIFYYTKEEYVPKNDMHWEIVKISNLDQYFTKDYINNKQNIENIKDVEDNKKSADAVC